MVLITYHLSIIPLLAQGFEFQYHGKTIANGGMVTIAAVEDDFGFGELWCETNPSSAPANGLVLKMLGDREGRGTATMTIEHNTVDAAVVKWCMGGVCNMMNTITSLQKNFTTMGGMAQVMFDAENLRSTGYLLATLSATILGEKHEVKIQFTNGAEADVKGISCDSDNSAVWYDLCGRRVTQPAKGIYISNGKKRAF